MLATNRGLSLIELIVVLGIIGILFTIAGLSASTWRNRYDVESQTKKMAVDLMNARVSAMQKNRVYFVVLANTQYTLYEDTNPAPDGDGTLQTGSDKKVIETRINHSITYGAAQTTFDTRGLVTAGAQTIRVDNPFGAAYNCIVISATRIRMGGMHGATCSAQ